MKKKQGKLIVFSAPSGSGKTSIVRYLLNKTDLNLAFSISATSRKPRGTEENGVDYYFISTEEFKKQISEDLFAEWEEVYENNLYGTYKKEIKRIWDNSKHIIFDIDVVGGLNIKKRYPEKTLAVFVKPPSVDELEKRLRNRKTDSEKKIKERVSKAKRELEYEKDFDVTVVNDVLDNARKEAYQLIKDFIEK